MEIIRILIVGDTVGKPGRLACKKIIPMLRETAEEIFSAGADILTSGDHVFRKKEGIALVEENPLVLRPLNYPQGCPGNGSIIFTTKTGVKVGVINLMGRVFIQSLDCPFQTVEQAIKSIKSQTKIILIDLHAEATSEKVAMGWFLDGEVSALCGTHTHVQTADETILPKGTAYITDLGMTGPFRSVIGRDIDQILYRYKTQMPGPMDVATEDVRLSGVIIEVETASGKARSIERIQVKLNDIK